MSHNSVLKIRDELSALWHQKSDLWGSFPHFGFASEDQYFAFCAAKDWIQDTGEVLYLHRRTGFSESPHSAYLEFWGILQAAIIQQDAILELQYAFKGVREELPSSDFPAWFEIRTLRNLAVGHPTRKGGGHVPTSRCMTGRQPKSYIQIPLTIYSKASAEHRDVNLGDLLDEYDSEGGDIMQELYHELEALLQN